jgi:hypothetical protein
MAGDSKVANLYKTALALASKEPTKYGPGAVRTREHREWGAAFGEAVTELAGARGAAQFLKGKAGCRARGHDRVLDAFRSHRVTITRATVAGVAA